LIDWQILPRDGLYSLNPDSIFQANSFLSYLTCFLFVVLSSGLSSLSDSFSQHVKHLLSYHIMLQKYRAVAFAAYGLIAVSRVIGVYAMLTSFAHMTIVCTVACFTASPLCTWIISILFLLSFDFPFTEALMVCGIFLNCDIRVSVFCLLLYLCFYSVVRCAVFL